MDRVSNRLARVCDSCASAVLEEADEIGLNMDWDEADIWARELGADIADHICSARDEGQACGCACRLHDTPRKGKTLMKRTKEKLAKAVGVSDTDDLPYLAWPGGYPLFYLDSENNVYCPTCANAARPTMRWYGVNWEHDALYCDTCCKRIPSAYADDDDSSEKEVRT